MGCTEPQAALAQVEPSSAPPLHTIERLIPTRILQRWLPIVVKFGFVQSIVQIVGFATGILIVRQLPKREYAYYTIGNTMLSTILLLADSGISSALSSIGGRLWHDNYRFRSLINTALQLRRQLAALTLVCVVPWLVWLLLQNGAGVQKTAALAVAVLAGSGLELVTRIYAVALRLRSQIQQIQTQALVAAFVKLAIVGLAAFLWLNALIAILSVVVGYAVQYWMLRKWVSKNLDEDAPSDPKIRSEVLGVIRKQAPHTIYYCFQGQITVWLISVFGSTENVANIGALGRLALILSVLSSVTADVILPAFARIRAVHQLRVRYLQIVLGYLATSVVLVGFVALFSTQAFSVLGRQYSDLHSEGVLMALSAVLGTMGGLFWAVNASRAWIVPPLLLIPCTLAVQIGLVWILDLSTVRGVLWFSIYSSLPSLILSVWRAVSAMREDAPLPLNLSAAP
jgi:O-antigen/teichoic acid export membrane protein